MGAKLYRVDGTIKKIEPQNGNTFSLEEMQNFVDGYIEVVNMGTKKFMIVNEEGKISGLPVNFMATELHKKQKGYHELIVGDVIICDKSYIK
jgi:hypothetical protein